VFAVSEQGDRGTRDLRDLPVVNGKDVSQVSKRGCVMDTQQFMNLFWIALEILMLIFIGGFSYSIGWRRGWARCISVRQELTYVPGGYGNRKCRFDHQALVDDIIRRSLYGYHSCPECKTWLITLGASVAATPVKQDGGCTVKGDGDGWSAARR
jgi:hypothetical protein